MRLLILVLTLLVVPVLGSAGPVDPANPYGIAAIHSSYEDGQEDEHYVLCVDGRIQRIQRYTDPKFRFVSATNPGTVPVPVTDIADWSWRSFMTHDGDLWVYHGYDQQWYALSGAGNFNDPDCGDPVEVESSSMGDVKSMYR
jgi:hypothetical protein